MKLHRRLLHGVSAFALLGASALPLNAAQINTEPVFDSASLSTSEAVVPAKLDLVAKPGPERKIARPWYCYIAYSDAWC